MKKVLQLLGWTVLAVLVSLPCFADDSAILRNGFSIKHEHRKVLGSITRLYLTSDDSSFVDVPTAEIDHFEILPRNPVSSAPEATAAKTAAKSDPPAQLASIDAQPLDLNEVVRSASGTYRLDPDLVASVIRAESGFNVRAVSPKGAQGLMQLMPQTAYELGVNNAFDARANVEGGTRYLRELLERYDFDLIKALAAYNAGPERVEQYGGVPPFYETKAYVARVVRDFNKKKLAEKNAQTAESQKAASKPSPKSTAKPPAANKAAAPTRRSDAGTTASR